MKCIEYILGINILKNFVKNISFILTSMEHAGEVPHERVTEVTKLSTISLDNFIIDHLHVTTISLRQCNEIKVAFSGKRPTW